jgi:excisionase family DNA binding protein
MTDPGSRLPDRRLSPRQLAVAIGVSESSLKRWIDDGLLEASRTAGRHRRIPLAEAIRFIRSRQTPIVRPEVLGLPDLSLTGADLTPSRDQSDRLFSLLTAGRAAGVRGMLLRMYVGGMSVAEIADGPLRQALERIGDIWTHSADGVYLEHRATDICLQAMNQVRLLIVPPADAPRAVGGAPSGDPYLLASMLAACVLGENGFHADNLGPNTPAEMLVRAAQDVKAVLCWLSVSSPRDPLELTALIDNLALRLGGAGTALVVGGHGVESLAPALSATVHVGRSMGALAQIARSIIQSLRAT